MPRSPRPKPSSGHQCVTTYFYWYDIESKSHILDPDGSDALITHPPTLQSFGYKNADWHQTQLGEMHRTDPPDHTIPAQRDLRTACFPILVEALEIVVVEGHVLLAGPAASATKPLLAIVVRADTAERHVVPAKRNGRDVIPPPIQPEGSDGAG